jgi:hypothetical protein
MAVLAPIPNARAAIAAMVNPGAFRSIRTACPISLMELSILALRRMLNDEVYSL